MTEERRVNVNMIIHYSREVASAPRGYLKKQQPFYVLSFFAALMNERFHIS